MSFRAPACVNHQCDEDRGLWSQVFLLIMIIWNAVRSRLPGPKGLSDAIDFEVAPWRWRHLIVCQLIYSGTERESQRKRKRGKERLDSITRPTGFPFFFFFLLLGSSSPPCRYFVVKILVRDWRDKWTLSGRWQAPCLAPLCSAGTLNYRIGLKQNQQRSGTNCAIEWSSNGREIQKDMHLKWEHELESLNYSAPTSLKVKLFKKKKKKSASKRPSISFSRCSS